MLAPPPLKNDPDTPMNLISHGLTYYPCPQQSVAPQHPGHHMIHPLERHQQCTDDHCAYQG